MTVVSTLPRVQAQLVDARGQPTREFYSWFQSVVSGIEGQITDLSAIVQGLVDISKSLGSPAGSTTDIIDVVSALQNKVDTTRIVTGAFSVRGGGELTDDVILQLENDSQFPGLEMMYATDIDGNRGWLPQGLASFINTDALPEGSTNLYFTDERAQDAVGTILVGSGDVPLAYNDSAPSVGASLSATGVAAGTYGSSTKIPQITVDTKGRITSVTLVSIGGSTFGILISEGGSLLTSTGGRLLGTT